MTTFYKVGKIVNTQGLRGEVRVISTTDFAEERYKKGTELAIFKDIKESYINGLEKADRYNLYLPQSYYSEYPDLSVTLPFVYGAKLEMDREHYMIRRYSNRVLLYANYGIKDRFNMIYSDVGDYGRLQELGFNSFSELYLFVFDKLTSYPLKESYDFIRMRSQPQNT
mgnify:CR=1 FL=1